MRKRLVVLGLCTAVLGAVGAFVAIDHGSGAATNGPLYLDGSLGLFDSVKPGQGGLVLEEPPIENRSNRPLTIDSISLDVSAAAPQRLQVGQTAIGLPQRPNGSGADYGPINQAHFGPYVPARGAVIGPAGPAGSNGLQGYSLIFAVNIDGAGIAWATGATVYYHVGSTHYVARAHELLVLCTNTSDGGKCRSEYQTLAGDPNNLGLT